MTVSVFPEDVSPEDGESESRAFSIALSMSSRGTAWLDYVVRDGVFQFEKGRD